MAGTVSFLSKTGSQVNLIHGTMSQRAIGELMSLMKNSIVVAVFFTFVASVVWAQGPGGPVWEQWEHRKRETQDRICGVPETILRKQRLDRVQVPPMEDAIAGALLAADKAAEPLIDRTYHTGKTRIVPDQFSTIQSAIDTAQPRDVVLVKPGTYFELIVMKDGVKLVSDATNGGDRQVAVAGARLTLPQRTLRTVIDGSRAKASKRGMIDFNEEVSRKAIVDGFTIQNLPMQDHHVPGHAHAINARGASPVIMNCYVRDNGSTGLGSHVVFQDQDKPIQERDFRWSNIKKKSQTVIFRNIFQGNVGLGIGCNHFSNPFILGNEVLSNSDAQLGHAISPGIGIKHGAHPIIIGNIVHDNPGGGILSKTGDPQGAYPIDRPTHPTVKHNVVFRNGRNRPAISARGSGSEKMPVQMIGNVIYDAGTIGLGLLAGAVGIIEKNLISGANAPGIEVNNAVALKLNANQVTGAKGPGIVMANNATVLDMVENVADKNRGPRFMLQGGHIAGMDGP